MDILRKDNVPGLETLGTRYSTEIFKMQRYLDGIHSHQSIALGMTSGGALGIFFPMRTLPATLFCTGVAWFILRPKINEKMKEFIDTIDAKAKGSSL
jgi:hypothetical protein